MYFTHDIQIFASKCTDNNNFIGDADGCIWKMWKRERKVSIAIEGKRKLLLRELNFLRWNIKIYSPEEIVTGLDFTKIKLVASFLGRRISWTWELVGLCTFRISYFQVKLSLTEKVKTRLVSFSLNLRSLDFEKIESKKSTPRKSLQIF